LNRLIRDKQPKATIEAARAEMNQMKHITTLKPGMGALMDGEMAVAVIFDIEHAVGVLDELMSRQDALDDEDVKLYTTTVHGVKSTLANIGKKELSAAAYELEKVGIDNRVDEIFSKTPGFVELLRTLLVSLKPESTADSNGPTEASDTDIVFLREKLEEIKSACERIKKSEAKAALNALKQRTWQHEVNSLLDEISEKLLLGEFKSIVALVEKQLSTY
jgi:HPt (histidine-containing phosphotransfer) domain-containing protein